MPCDEDWDPGDVLSSLEENPVAVGGRLLPPGVKVGVMVVPKSTTGISTLIGSSDEHLVLPRLGSPTVFNTPLLLCRGSMDALDSSREELKLRVRTRSSPTVEVGYRNMVTEYWGRGLEDSNRGDSGAKIGLRIVGVQTRRIAQEIGPC